MASTLSMVCRGESSPGSPYTWCSRAAFRPKGALVVTYSAEFSFGYDLAPGSYDVVDTPAGIEIRVARAKGARMEGDAEIVALCERTLTAFLHDFLAKQPGVERVPAITVSYKHAGTAG